MLDIYPVTRLEVAHWERSLRKAWAFARACVPSDDAATDALFQAVEEAWPSRGTQPPSTGALLNAVRAVLHRDAMHRESMRRAAAEAAERKVPA